MSNSRILLLDTDAASKLQVNKLRLDYKAIVDTYDMVAISWVTEAEWQVGLLLNQNPHRQARFETWLNKVVRIGQDPEVTRCYAELSAVAKQHNQTTKKRQNDTWVAAVAVRHQIPLMTLNRSDFDVFARHGRLVLEPPIF